MTQFFSNILIKYLLDLYTGEIFIEEGGIPSANLPSDLRDLNMQPLPGNAANASVQMEDDSYGGGWYTFYIEAILLSC